MNMPRRNITTRATLVGLGATLAAFSQVALASTAHATGTWDESRVRIQSARGDCLTAVPRSTNQLDTERCDTDNLRGNWRMVDNLDANFLLKNWSTGECLDSERNVLGGKVYMSACDQNDGGQVWRYDCFEGRLMNLASTTFLTRFTSGVVGHQQRSTSDIGKQVWNIVPRPHAC
ncbi:RICIN domain-containing protein [Streptomyces sp. DSM 40907]|uniref:RICIN domain-containing protein n=1 Tax=Streptomyces kutzneri TaxID=3051179 RepID=UPI0028D8C4D0|nr:RICIN domain-containing protein [Streptomyces sp. DSM 40907]